jgi:hypothetical protein
MPAEDSIPPSDPPPVAISYRSVQIGLTNWAVVDSFESIGQWHAAKAMLDRNGVLVRMLSNPFDESVTDLLVPSTDMLWATDLIRRMSAPKIERSLGFPMVRPIPTPDVGSIANAYVGSDSTGAMQVLELDHSSDSRTVTPNYGCVLAGCWVLLVVVVILLVMFFVMSQ